MRGRQALLVVDLEGVAGVDSPGALISGMPEYTRARALLTAEVNAAVEGLLAAGFHRVRVSDSHLCGSGESNLLPEALHPAAEPCFLPEDAYAAPLFEDVEAVACLGMHAAAGPVGFAAHTVDVLGAWTCAGRALSEADLVLALAAEAGVPAVFVSGDDVLQAQLGGRVAYVRTKVALSSTRAYSREPEAVLPELTHAAALPARHVEPLPDVPLVLTFKSGHQAALAAQAGARRLDPYRVEVEGCTFRERYTRALEAASAAGAVLADAVAEGPGGPGFLRDATALFRLRGPPAHPPAPRTEAVDRALGAFLSLTQGEDDESRALRALTLHMLEGHAPGAFARRGLGPTLEAAVAALAEVPLALPDGLSPDVGMARVDAWYVRRERGLPHAPLEPSPCAPTWSTWLTRATASTRGCWGRWPPRAAWTCACPSPPGPCATSPAWRTSTGSPTCTCWTPATCAPRRGIRTPRPGQKSCWWPRPGWWSRATWTWARSWPSASSAWARPEAGPTRPSWRCSRATSSPMDAWRMPMPPPARCSPSRAPRSVCPASHGDERTGTGGAPSFPDGELAFHGAPVGLCAQALGGVDPLTS
ncbi:D-aminopeptidase dipeptide-binding protein DppA [Archangium gephyra]|uniref:D-aminopeptidase dipeptide-binding protein DppA n=1 Tax=Archangium gephyra TaxID=48 RepID=A0AAC8Q287_9BACT|nr:M55 family metallopeptidase [Archangium gephyra]AKI99679.1 D-aminopeptidase dipeptide-binding protein DppA [Archangium gephyra]